MPQCIRYTYEDVLPLAQTTTKRCFSEYKCTKGLHCICYMKRLLKIMRKCYSPYGIHKRRLRVICCEFYTLSQVSLEELPLYMCVEPPLAQAIVERRLALGK